VALEKDKIKGAVRTDFILSAEIIVITLGTVAGPLRPQQVVLVGIALVMTVGVYGLVAGIVKLDDLGLWLSRRQRGRRRPGPRPPGAAPWLMKGCRWPAPRRCSWSAAASWCTARPGPMGPAAQCPL
jgi:predicted DNA repair protein MutK